MSWSNSLLSSFLALSKEKQEAVFFSLISGVGPAYQSQIEKLIRSFLPIVGSDRAAVAPQGRGETAPGAGGESPPDRPEAVALRGQTGREPAAGSDVVGTRVSVDFAPLAASAASRPGECGRLFPAVAEDGRDQLATMPARQPLPALAGTAVGVADHGRASMSAVVAKAATLARPPQAAAGGAALGNTADLVLMRSESLPVASPAVVHFRPRKKNRVNLSRGAALTPSEVCARLEISRSTLDREIRSGRFPPPLKIGRQWRWRLVDVDHFLSHLTDMSPYLRKCGKSDWHQRFGDEVRANHSDMYMVALIRRTVEERGLCRGTSRRNATENA